MKSRFYKEVGIAHGISIRQYREGFHSKRQLSDDFEQFNRPICKVKCTKVTETEQHFIEHARKKRSLKKQFVLRGIQMAKDVKVGDKGKMYYRSTETWGLYFFIPNNPLKKGYHWDLDEQKDRTMETVIEEVKRERISQ